jgi:hypothetical protein
LPPSCEWSIAENIKETHVARMILFVPKPLQNHLRDMYTHHQIVTSPTKLAMSRQIRTNPICVHVCCLLLCVARCRVTRSDTKISVHISRRLCHFVSCPERVTIYY